MEPGLGGGRSSMGPPNRPEGAKFRLQDNTGSRATPSSAKLRAGPASPCICGCRHVQWFAERWCGGVVQKKGAQPCTMPAYLSLSSSGSSAAAASTCAMAVLASSVSAASVAAALLLGLAADLGTTAWLAVWPACGQHTSRHGCQGDTHDSACKAVQPSSTPHAAGTAGNRQLET